MSGTFIDQKGRATYRNSGLGDQGLIFRFPDESVYVYWSTAAFDPDEMSNPTWPFSKKDYYATTLLRCRAAGGAEFGSCPSGILRMDDRQASIVVLSPGGEQFTINFMTDYVNATNRRVASRPEGDTWVVTINGGEGILRGGLAARPENKEAVNEARLFSSGYGLFNPVRAALRCRRQSAPTAARLWQTPVEKRGVSL